MKYPLFLLILMKLEFSWQIFHNFHENPSCRNQVVPCRWKDGQTDMTKLIVPFHNSAIAPKKEFVSFSVVKHGRNRITKGERRWNKFIQFGKLASFICLIHSEVCFLFQIYESVLWLQCTFVSVMLVDVYDWGYAFSIKFQFLIA